MTAFNFPKGTVRALAFLMMLVAVLVTVFLHIEVPEFIQNAFLVAVGFYFGVRAVQS